MIVVNSQRVWAVLRFGRKPWCVLLCMYSASAMPMRKNADERVCDMLFMWVVIDNLDHELVHPVLARPKRLRC